MVEQRRRAPFARRRFGQHFLEPAWVDKLIRAIDPRPDDVFVEIGSGRGALTRPLAAKAKAVIACEIDRDLAASLRADRIANVTIVDGDFLESRWLEAGRPAGRLRVAGNLPYNVASPILFKLGELYRNAVPIADATLMLQREVADRLIAAPGTRDYSVLTVLFRHAADVRRVLVLPPGAFRPSPKVQSAVVHVEFHDPEPAPRDSATFVALVRAIFTRRRKTLANALRAFESGGGMSPDEALAIAGIDGRRRPETLAIPELVRLADAFAGAVL
jgi:16S rRNA (adenine1518-N6/adenine1519-N6)-dimethyltransferase